MAKNRRIPFGYQMIDGEITTHPREVYAVSKIELAKLKYDCCTYDNVPQKTAFLKETLKDRKQLNSLDIELLMKSAEKITVSHNATIGLEFIQ